MNLGISFLIIMLIFALGKWYVRYKDYLTIIYHYREKGYPLPTDEELDKCREKAFANFWKHVGLKR